MNAAATPARSRSKRRGLGHCHDPAGTAIYFVCLVNGSSAVPADRHSLPHSHQRVISVDQLMDRYESLTHTPR